MKLKKKLLGALALFTLPGAAFAQPAQAPAQTPAPAPQAQAPRPDADPAMWVVRDNDTTVYLFGTFHLLNGQRDWFNEEVRTAFDASQELVLEIVQPSNPADVQQTVMRYAMAEGGRPLSQRIPASLREPLSRELAELGLPAAGVESFDPWFVSLTMTVMGGQRLGLTGEQGAEAILTAAARQRNMPIGELETLQGQLEMFDRMPEAAQIAQLQSTVEQLDRLQETLQPMLTAWADGDVDALARQMDEGLGESPDVRRILLTDRNARWAEWIQQRMQRPGTVFVAVGAGHLGGQGSVQDHLRQRGITATRVAH
jgi:hypothetical protein